MFWSTILNIWNISYFKTKLFMLQFQTYKGVGSMKDILIGSCMKLIRKEQPQLSEVQLEQIEYGLAGVYLSITKLVIIITIAYLLKIQKECACFLIIFAILRNNAYGIHATKSWVCLITSSAAFLGIPTLAMNLIVPFQIKYILGIIASILIFKNSPADTKKRPIIDKQKRLRHKLLATLTAIIYVILSIFLKNNFLSNCFFMSILLMDIMISPITYHIFKLPYNNYLSYLKEEEGVAIC